MFRLRYLVVQVFHVNLRPFKINHSIMGHEIFGVLEMGWQMLLHLANGVRKVPICLRNSSTPVPSIKNDSSLSTQMDKISCEIKKLLVLWPDPSFL